jgi:hypothetical protein
MTDTFTVAGIFAAALDEVDREREARRATRVNSARELLGLFFSPDVNDVAGSRLRQPRGGSPAQDVRDKKTNQMKRHRYWHHNKISRLLLRRLGELERQGNLPDSADFDVALDQMRSDTAVELAAMRAPERSRRFVVAGENVGVDTGKLAVETSWLDEPFEQWFVETPADPAAEEATAEAAARERDSGCTRTAATAAAPALPRLPSGYSRSRALADTGVED